jgi:hypothetical protein
MKLVEKACKSEQSAFERYTRTGSPWKNPSDVGPVYLPIHELDSIDAL